MPMLHCVTKNVTFWRFEFSFAFLGVTFFVTQRNTYIFYLNRFFALKGSIY